MSSATVALSSDVLVRQWVDAFNARDVDGMLARLDPEVRLHPLRLRGLDGSYNGHDGVQRWFERLAQLRHEHVIVLSDVHGAGDDQVLAVGSLRLVGNVEIAPFCAPHRIAGGLIAAAHHCLSNPDMLEHLGLVP